MVNIVSAILAGIPFVSSLSVRYSDILIKREQGIFALARTTTVEEVIDAWRNVDGVVAGRSLGSRAIAEIWFVSSYPLTLFTLPPPIFFP
jgi:hypothetical protein